MTSIIPIELYTPIYYYFILAVVLYVFLHSQYYKIDNPININRLHNIGIGVLFIIIAYMGLRPIDGVFVDMRTYANTFDKYGDGFAVRTDKDPVFQYFMYSLAQFLPAEAFFFICTLLYVLPLYVVSKRWFGHYWFLSFLILVSSFSFWAYGVNGIRSGISGSLFLLALSTDKQNNKVLLFLLSIGFHLAFILPVIGYIIGSFVKNSKYILSLWLLAIPLSILLPGFWESLISSLGIGDARMGYFTAEAAEGSFRRTGYRWDFLLYSASAVGLGWYYIYVCNFNDKIYHLIFSVFLFSNAFWVLVNRAAFSNRIAYLSWFMIGLVLIYPLLKENIMKNQYQKIGIILLINVLFTFVMAIIL